MVVFIAEHHKDRVHHVVFSPDESTFASISWNAMYVCDSETGHCISGPFELSGHGIGRDACFSPDGRHILLKFDSGAVVWNIETGEEQPIIEGYDFAFVRIYDGRIASTHWVDEGGNSRYTTRILVKICDTSNGASISNRSFEVDDVAITQFSPDGRFLAVGRKSKGIIELRSLEDGTDSRQFLYSTGKLSSLHFSPTSDTLMAVFREKPCHICLWRLDTRDEVFFSHDFDDGLHVIYSPLTNYLFIERDHTVEIWDVSVGGSRMIWETKPPATSYVGSICPSRDGQRLLVGHYDGSVRMWDLGLDLGLKDSAINQADTTNTQDDTDMQQVITLSHSGKVVATKPQKSRNIEFLDTATREVVARTDIEHGENMEIAFSPDEDQVAFLSESLITICDITQPGERISFNPWPGKNVHRQKVAFQTYNDLVVCAISRDDDSTLLQVWHRQGPAEFERTYSSDIKTKQFSYPFLAPNGLTVVIISLPKPNPTCYSWNHNNAQFDRVQFDDQVHINWKSSLPVYSPDGKHLACWSWGDYHVRVWDTRTYQLIHKFPTPGVDEIAFSPDLIDLSLSNRFIVLRFNHENTIRLFDYTDRSYAQILGRADTHLAFIRDGTALAYFSHMYGLRIWNISDLITEDRRSTHGYELMMQGIRDGWMIGQDHESLFWVPVEHRRDLYAPPSKVVIKAPQINSTILDLTNSRLGGKWTDCIDKGWLRELEQEEKKVGNLLE